MCRTDNKKMAYKDSCGSRGAGGPVPLSFVDEIKVRRAENKKILKPPSLSQGLDPPLKDYVLLPEWKSCCIWNESFVNSIQNTYLPAKYDMTLSLDCFFSPSRLCLDALVHRCLSVGLTFQVLLGFTLNINHLYAQIFLMFWVSLSVMISWFPATAIMKSSTH